MPAPLESGEKSQNNQFLPHVARLIGKGTLVHGFGGLKWSERLAVFFVTIVTIFGLFVDSFKKESLPETGPEFIERRVAERDSPKGKSAGSPGPGEQAVLSREEQTGERRGEEGDLGQHQLPGQGRCL
jgi:hypothetical protein